MTELTEPSGKMAAGISSPSAGCRLCSLAARNPNIVLVVHELHRRGVSGVNMRLKLEAVFAEAGEAMPSPEAFAKHFEEHTSIVPGISAEAAQRAAVDQETDYFELRILYQEFRRIFSDVRESFSQAHLHGEGTSAEGLLTLVKLASELRHMLKVLSDMRNSERLVSVILSRHTEHLVSLLTEPIGISLREVRDRLRRGEDGQVVADRLDAMLRGELYPIFESAAQTALDQSKQQYKLH